MFNWSRDIIIFLNRYGRVYAPEAYHHSVGPTTYGVGTMVSSYQSKQSLIWEIHHGG